MRTYTIRILQNNERRLKSKIDQNKKNPKNSIRNEQKHNVIILIRKQHKKTVDKHMIFFMLFYIFFINLLRVNVQSGRTLKTPFASLRRNAEERSH